MSDWRPFTDEEITACGFGDIAESYQELRARYETLLRKDRSTILRMAGNIASGVNREINNGEDVQRYAKDVVLLARAILAEVDR